MTTRSWIAGASGDWSTAANWVSGTVPGATDDVVIDFANSLTINGTVVVNSLKSAGSQFTIGGSLTIGTALMLDGDRLFLNGGTLSVKTVTSQAIMSSGAAGLGGYGTIHITDPVSGFIGIGAAGGTLKADASAAAGRNNVLGYSISPGATLELSGTIATSVSFLQNGFLNGKFEEHPATLKLDTPAAFSGSLDHLSIGDMVNLIGITASSATTSYTGDITITQANGQQFIYPRSYVEKSVKLLVGSNNNGGTFVYVTSGPTSESTTIKQEVAGLYAALYNRAADDVGMRYWVNVVAQQADAVGVNLASAADTPISANDAALLGQLFVSTQNAYFNQTYGHLSDVDFVSALYLNMGGQHPETSSAITYWVNVIQRGEASGLSMQSARAAMVGQFVHDLIDIDLAQWTSVLSPSELQATVLRQAVVNNKLAVSLAYVSASATPAGVFLNAHDVGDAAFQAQVTALAGMVITPLGAAVMADAIHRAVIDHNLADIQVVGVLMPHPML